MNVKIVNTLDSRSGAAIAARRLARELASRSELAVEMVVRSRLSDGDSFTKGLQSKRKSLFSFIDKLPWRLRCKVKEQLFSSQWIGHPNALRLIGKADVFHLHWVAGGFLSTAQIRKLPGPIVWTLHDLNPVTGGCHYPGSCDHFHRSCGDCPLLRGGARDLSFHNLARRKRLLSTRDVLFVAPSEWLAKQARAASVAEGQTVEVIHNGIDLNIFKPAVEARSDLDLSGDKLVITYVADDPNDPRKGLDLLVQGIGSLTLQQRKQILLVVIGRSPRQLTELELDTHFTGPIWDENALAKYLQASDWTVCPSRQDNLPNILLESLGCGTPVAGFATGGIAEIICDGKNGILGKPFEAEALLQAMVSIPLSALRTEWRTRAREDACTRFDIRKQADRHIAAYHSLAEDAR